MLHYRPTHKEKKIYRISSSKYA